MTFTEQLRDDLKRVAGQVIEDQRMGRVSRDAASEVILSHGPSELNALEATARAMIDLIIALEDAEAIAKDSAEQARRALLAALEATTGWIQNGTHRAAVANGRASVVITDGKLVPDAFMHQPPPMPNKTAILEMLKQGRTVAGAEMRNGAPHLRLTNVTKGGGE
jgi:hypothetical protein